MSKKKKPVAKYDLSDISPRHIAIVEGDGVRPAVPAATISLVKTLDTNEVPFSVFFEVKKFDGDKGQVFGRVLVPDEPDWQGDTISSEEVEKAAHKYLENLAKGLQDGNATSVNHDQFDDIGYPIASWVDHDGSVQKTFLGIEKDDIKPGAWVFGMQLTNDDLKKKAQDGDLKGFSIGGTGKRKPKSFAQDKIDQLKTFIFKGDGDAQSYQEIKDREDLSNKLWNAVYRLGDSLRTILSDDTVTDKQAMAKESFKQTYSDIMALITAASGLASSDIDELKSMVEKIEGIIIQAEECSSGAAKTSLKKVGEEMSVTEKDFADLKGNVETLTTTVSELTKSVKDLTTSVSESSENLRKFSEMEVKGEGDKVTKMSTADVLALSINALAKLTERVDVIGKSIFGSRTVDPEPVKKTGDNDPGKEGEVKKSALDGTPFDIEFLNKTVTAG